MIAALKERTNFMIMSNAEVELQGTRCFVTFFWFVCFVFFFLFFFLTGCTGLIRETLNFLP